ncbi:MAG TPA: SagB/ThcOx family dehydrogenase [Gaiellaceae bacterium]|nr:SagB/ThcOx family dehydrogenase [Gaiellaceae bacterium]
MTSPIPTAQFASVVYGEDVPLDDPAERFHEAAKLYPCSAGRQMSGVALLARNAALQQSVERAGRRFSHLPSHALPEPRWPTTTLPQALRSRRSLPPAAGSRIDLADLATVLAATNGLSEHPGRRHTPSGGALYPLELYAIAREVEGLPAGIYHFDPHTTGLEQLSPEIDDVEECLVDASTAEDSAAILVVSGVFWRSRFKYGLRGYRFALLEAGHAIQNAVLVATALELAALPVGGYYDARIESLLGIDGVNESALYLLALGRP